jgi:hypothetical protein
VDVAAEHHDACLVEQHRLRRHAGVERQLEALRGRERVHVMAHAVLVRERDGRAHVHGLDLRHELLVDLLELLGARPGTARRRAAFGLGRATTTASVDRLPVAVRTVTPSVPDLRAGAHGGASRMQRCDAPGRSCAHQYA